MKRFFGILLFTFAALNAGAQLPDSVRTKKFYPVKVSKPVVVSHRIIAPEVTPAPLSIYGEYKIAGYTVLGHKAPSTEELNRLVGTIVKVDSSAITGPQIDPMTYSIYGVEMLRRDDYIYREFGNDVNDAQPGLPEQFNVHKTDHDQCYGIAEIGRGQLAIPYKGTLLYLQKN